MRFVAINFVTLIALLTASAIAQESKPPKPSLEQRAIATAKQVSAKSLDNRIPDQPFAKWFQSVVGAEVEVRWEANDCGEQTGDPTTTPADPPLCAQASAFLPNQDSVNVMILVGSYKKGITGKPIVFYAAVDSLEDGVTAPVKTLHELPKAIENLHGTKG